MNYKRMNSFINEQIDKYKSGDIVIDEDAFTGFSKITDLKPYAFVAFVDQYENVLEVKNNLEKISSQIAVGYDYQDVRKINEQISDSSFYTYLISCLVLIVFIIGSIIVEFLYLRKYQSVFKILRLNGYSLRLQKQLVLLHVIWQLMIILTLAMLVYLSGSIPDILSILKPEQYRNIYVQLPQVYFYYYIYTHFSLLHFMIVCMSLILVVSISHFIVYQYSHRKLKKLYP